MYVTPQLSATPPLSSSVSSEARRAILSRRKNAHPRGSGASSGTTVEDCSIHGQDNPAKGTRAREKNACVDPPRMVEEGKYVRTYVLDSRTSELVFGKTRAYIVTSQCETKLGGDQRVSSCLFPLMDRSRKTSRSNYRDSLM